MKTKHLILALLLVPGFGFSRAENLQLRGDVPGDLPHVQILRHDAKLIELEVRFPILELKKGFIEGRLWDRVEMPGGSFDNELGMPEVPHYTRLLSIPSTTGIRVEIETREVEVISDIELMPAQGIDPQDSGWDFRSVYYDTTTYNQDELYPPLDVQTGEPVIMRGLRLIPMRMNPIRYNPLQKELQIAHRFRIKAYLEGSNSHNCPASPPRPISSSWAELARGTVLNFDELDLEIVPLGSYLIICENDPYLVDELLAPLMDWKTRKGHSVTVQTFAPGTNNYTIKNIIQTAYNTWEIPPEYVLLVGDVSGDYALPGWLVGDPGNYDQTDHQYSLLDGVDPLADVAIGRLPAETETEVRVMVNKILYYEKTPYIVNDEWYHQGVLVAGNSFAGISSIQANRWIKTRMIWNEYTRIDTFWYNMSGSVASTLTPAINGGVSICNYRGNMGMEDFTINDIENLLNGSRMPFVVTITCCTGGFAGTVESLMECFARVGTVLVPQGAIACIGTATPETHTRQNNTLDMGVFAGIFDDNITMAGNALNRGRLELFNTYFTNDPGTVYEFSEFVALAGDPGVDIYNGPMHYMTSNIPTIVDWGENLLSLSVSESGVGPVEDAIVCIWKPGDLHEVGKTGLGGNVTLPLNAGNIGNVKVTITKHNYCPIIDSLEIVQADIAVGYSEHTIDDDSSGTSIGDSDGTINSGERVEIPITLKNYGSSITATDVTLNAITLDEYATLIDDAETFPDLSPGGFSVSDDDIDITISADCPNGHVIQLETTTQAVQGTWDGLLNLPVISYDAVILSAIAAGNDTILSPGETSDFILTITNSGDKAADSLVAVISSLSPDVFVSDNSAFWGRIEIGETADCSNNPFILTAGNCPPGHQVDLSICFFANNGAMQKDTVTITLGQKSGGDPQGPDAYGYFCFDDTDIDYAPAPTYGWVEIDPAYGGQGIQLPLSDPALNQDVSRNVPLPFTFRYYGEETNEITVCSNGWISTWANDSFTDFRNYPIPSLIGPNGMIAAFWDDLVTWSNGHIFSLDDAINHRFIVQWSRLNSAASPLTEQTFQIILYDPVYYPTVTGDGDILFQYHTIEDITGLSTDNPFSTVGIESPDQRDGIEVVYWNTYEDPAAARLQDGRAYLFTMNFDYYQTPMPIIVVSSYFLNFGYITIGEQSDLSLTVHNIGDADLLLYDVSASGPDFVTNFDPSDSLIQPADSLLITVSFTPQDTIAYNQILSIISNDELAEVELSGVGMPLGAVQKIPPSIIPECNALFSTFPNPSNLRTTIPFALSTPAQVKISIFNLQGCRIGEIFSARREAGYHEVTFDATNFASGIYFYRLEAGDFTAVRKLVLLK